MEKKSIWKFLGAYKKESIIAPLFKCLEAIFELFVPLVVAAMVDNGIATGNRGYIVQRALLMVLLAVIGLACAVCAQYFSAKAATGFAAATREALFGKIQTFSYDTLDRIGIGSLLTRMNSDVNQMQTAVNLFLRLFMRSPFIVFGAMIMAFYVNPQSGLLLLGVIVILGIIVAVITKVTAPINKKAQENLEKVTLTTKESLDGAKVIRAFAREEEAVENFGVWNTAVYNYQKKAGNIQSFLNPVTYVIINLCLVLLLYTTGIKVNAGILTQGQVIALANYLSQILVELIKLANLIVQLTKAIPCKRRLEEIIFADDEKKSAKSEENLEKAEPIIFEHAAFTYNGAGAPVFSDISFEIRPGETVGIIGGTGAGKTTLLQLIMGLYEISSGKACYGARNIADINEADYLKLFAYVPQKAVLLSGTAKSALSMGVDIEDADLQQAMADAMAAEFMEKKEGLDTGVISGGTNFSGGQRQRLSIARALARKESPILVLDDSFSALDMATEKQLAENLAKYKGEKTMIIVSQRASSLRFADKIIVLDDGQIDAIGTAQELLEKSDIFREIYMTQYETCEVKGGSHEQ